MTGSGTGDGIARRAGNGIAPESRTFEDVDDVDEWLAGATFVALSVLCSGADDDRLSRRLGPEAAGHPSSDAGRSDNNDRGCRRGPCRLGRRWRHAGRYDLIPTSAPDPEANPTARTITPTSAVWASVGRWRTASAISRARFAGSPRRLPRRGPPPHVRASARWPRRTNEARCANRFSKEIMSDICQFQSHPFE